MGYNPSNFEGKNSNPVEALNWYEAIIYCNKLSERRNLKPYYEVTNVIKDKERVVRADVKIAGGTGYRLLTKEENEYAARGGMESKVTKYSGSNDLNEIAWYRENAYEKGRNSPDYGTHKVGTKKANELGIYDLNGNVWEWITDKDGNPLISGGSWMSGKMFCELQISGKNAPTTKREDYGFRVGRNANK